MAALRAGLLASSALIAAALPAAAQNATWLLNPGSGDFNTAANWSPATVPTGTAFFGASNTTALSFSAPITIGGWTFNAGASNYTFTNGRVLQFTGAGIVINGGSATIINNNGLEFFNASTAGSATITNNAILQFFQTARPAAPPSPTTPLWNSSRPARPAAPPSPTTTSWISSTPPRPARRASSTARPGSLKYRFLQLRA
jgi:hypothetical protein